MPRGTVPHQAGARRSIDAYLSVKRYVWEALGAPWDVRFAEEEGVFDRPMAMVIWGTPQGMEIRGTWARDATQTFTIHLYPSEGASPQESLVAAIAAGENIEAAITKGTTAVGHPMRIPLYDFTTAGITADVTEDDRHPSDYMRVSDLEVRPPVKDPDDDNFYTVVVSVQVKWAKPGVTPTGTQVVTSIHQEVDAH